MKVGITFSGAQGLGDRLQFSSFPENFHAATGAKVIDVEKEWFFDDNPFVIRDQAPDRMINPWTAPVPTMPPHGRPVWHSIAERTMVQFGLDPRHVVLRHPRLYRFENEPKRQRIVVHTTGVRGGMLSPQVIEHIVARYTGWEIIQVGGRGDIDFPHAVNVRGVDLWQVAKMIAGAQVFIGVCSGPSWIAAAYPSTWAKKVLMHLSEPELTGIFTPMAGYNKRWHWFDSSFTYFNRTEQDLGLSYSYRKL